MKRLFLLLALMLVLGFYALKTLKPHHIEGFKEQIEVTIVYHNETKTLNLEPYTELGEILDHLSLQDDVNYEKINPKKVLAHKDVINIPIISESKCVSINTANLEELMTLTGIGEKTANTIIAYRTNNGLFQGIEDLMLIKGIGPKKFEKMADSLCL